MARDATSIVPGAPYALVFPGQGAHLADAESDVYQRSATVRAVFEEAEATTGVSVRSLCLDEPSTELRRTFTNQICMFVLGVASFAAWADIRRARDDAAEPFAAAGHSIGHFSALVATEVIPYADALDLVLRRARLMQEAADEIPGGMIAVITEGAEVIARRALEEDPQYGACISSFNAPDQVVLSAPLPVLEQLDRRVRALGARHVLRLPVDAATHSPILNGAAREFASYVDKAALRSPRYPLVLNSSGKRTLDLDEVRADLRTQLTAPVLWRQSVETMLNEGVRLFVEMGPGRTLARLVRRVGGRDIIAESFVRFLQPR